MLDLALSMYVLEVTGSAALFAAFLAAAMVPTILLAPLGGVLADRGNPKAMMVGLDLASGTLTLLATLLVGHGHDLPVLCATLILLSILGAFETPVAQACLPLLLQGESLVRGNAAVNQVSAVSSLAGPFLGSLAYSRLGLQQSVGFVFSSPPCWNAFCSFLLLPIPQLATQEYGPLSRWIFKVVSTSSAESSPCCSVSYS